MVLIDRSDPNQQVWDAFLRSETTSDGRHDTPYWRAHANPYVACVIRVPATDLRPNLNALRHELGHLSGVRLHPDHFLHIMVQELGFLGVQPSRPDEISPARLEEFAQAATEPVALIAPFLITLGGANSFQDAIFQEVHHGEPLYQMHERLFDLAALPHTPAYPYLPHCTIAHYDGTADPREAESVLEPWRNVTFGESLVTEVEIVSIDPHQPYPELQPYAVIPLLG